MGSFFLYYIISLLLILPLASLFIESRLKRGEKFTFELAMKWFVFWAVGIRLFSAGITQILHPAFTGYILHLPESGFIIVRELGFANVCFGLLGIVSVCKASWRIPAAFAGGLYLGTAGIQHVLKLSEGMNTKETIAMISDLFIFLVMVFYLGSQVVSKK